MEISKDTLKRFISDKFSFNDYLSVSSWFKKEEYATELKNSMKEEWGNTKGTGNNKERLSIILGQIHHHIKNDTQYVKVSPFRKFYRKFSQIAAILLIPALITIVYFSHLAISQSGHAESYAEIYAPRGTRAKFKLPDGTEGWLNSGSSIKYPVSFNNRNVELSGEAWFNVTHHDSKEFRVVTPYFDVKVLGTQFNVVAYSYEETAEVILEKGKVAILDKNNNVKMDLTPDQQVIYNKSTDQLVKGDIDAKLYTCWKEGMLVFKNEPMSEIARRLERKYNMEIILHGESLKSAVFRATFSDESIDEICKMISEVAPIKYEIVKREIKSDSTFTRGKIEMWLKKVK